MIIGGIRNEELSISRAFNEKVNSICVTKIIRMASKVFETVALTIATISLTIIASIGSSTVNGYTIAAAAAAATRANDVTAQPHAAALSSPSSSSAAAISMKPDYGITNVTAQIGTNAYLPCKVSFCVVSLYIALLFVFFGEFRLCVLRFILNLYSILYTHTQNIYYEHVYCAYSILHMKLKLLMK